MGNTSVTATAPSQTGWFGNITNNLANLAASAAPLVGSITGNGTKAPAANAATPGTAANPNGSTSPNLILYVAGGAVALILVVVLVLRKK